MLLQRYQEICLTCNTRPHPEIENSIANHNRSNSNFITIAAISVQTQVTDEDVKPVAFLIKETKDKIFRLRFPSQKITDKGASIIASLFQVAGNLEAVILSGNEIQDEGVGAFAASFATSASLPSVLDISDNPISDNGVALLFRGFCLRGVPSRSHSVHLRLGGLMKATGASEGAVIEGLMTGLFASLVSPVQPVTESLRRAAFDVGTTLVECDLGLLNAKVLEIEAACAFPATHDAKMKRLGARIAELEKKLGEAEDREKQLLKRVVFLEENVAKEQDQCLKLLKQCNKLIQSNPL